MGFLEDQEFWALNQGFSGTDFAISDSQMKECWYRLDPKYYKCMFKALWDHLLAAAF